MAYQSEKLASLIQRECVSIINNIVRNDNWGYINIVAVKVNKDLSIATIYYTVLTDDREVLKKVQQSLENHGKSIRQELASKIKNSCKKVPDLIYKHDESLAYGNHIEKILKDLNK